jgi:hypothetical protein
VRKSIVSAALKSTSPKSNIFSIKLADSVGVNQNWKYLKYCILGDPSALRVIPSSSEGGRYEAVAIVLHTVVRLFAVWTLGPRFNPVCVCFVYQGSIQGLC